MSISTTRSCIPPCSRRSSRSSCRGTPSWSRKARPPGRRCSSSGIERWAGRAAAAARSDGAWAARSAPRSPSAASDPSCSPWAMAPSPIARWGSGRWPGTTRRSSPSSRTTRAIRSCDTTGRARSRTARWCGTTPTPASISAPPRPTTSRSPALRAWTASASPPRRSSSRRSGAAWTGSRATTARTWSRWRSPARGWAPSRPGTKTGGSSRGRLASVRALRHSERIPSMSHSRAGRAPSRASVRPLARWSRRAVSAMRAAPPAIRVVAGVVVILAVWSGVNWGYQVIRKPTELFFPVSAALGKTPPETWRKYEPLFREHSTAVITPELLAALAQVEGAGNPVARTYWRWRLTWNPLELYRPASSAVGMYQITNAMFAEARRYCIHDHVVVEDGPWHDFDSCWFNGLYARVVPSHAVEMTAAFLDRRVAGTIARRRITDATLLQKQDLAALIHLCGAAWSDGYARRGFLQTAGQRCGEHDVGSYLAQVHATRKQFARLAAAEP